MTNLDVWERIDAAGGKASLLESRDGSSDRSCQSVALRRVPALERAYDISSTPCKTSLWHSPSSHPKFIRPNVSEHTVKPTQVFASLPASMVRNQPTQSPV
ncbi:hypothetical protein FRB95_005249 [Tulasnella sp. JGI-2019a]|nr:hypothetical protein FRB95_005249 [Tulasnella sp. JGI-2019a]